MESEEIIKKKNKTLLNVIVIGFSGFVAGIFGPCYLPSPFGGALLAFTLLYFPFYLILSWFHVLLSFKYLKKNYWMLMLGIIYEVFVIAVFALIITAFNSWGNFKL
jgi:hypothetical protein